MSDSNPSKLRLPSKISRPCSALPQKQTPSPLSPTPTMNSSMVLTEDTDSFIIGDRVWVGGTKPGFIAYIGETQFAPGDWAGIVLDEPIGKNDGSVAGSRYFQCEPKRGIFSRLTRLTRQPLSETTIPPGERTPTGSVYGSRTNLSKSMSTSLHSSVTSLSSVSQKDVTIGDRVIVSSSQGSKAGVLRFLGPTQFASGDWCGVELDEPVGKNDGSVGEIRYFECRPRYGLFAPLHKVSRSPSSRRTSSTCIVHKPVSSLMTTPPGRLSGSRESIKSTSSRLSTTAGSTIRGMAPGSREMLKEKQQEIEMLRNERDLDRQRISRVAAQADNAEKNVITLKEEYDKYKELMELQMHETQTALTQFLHENNSLKAQLEEEKQKNEDLLFRFEEGSINMDDIQVINTQNENKMKELEKQLLEERERIIKLEQDNLKLIEARDELAKLRAQLSTTENTKTQELQDIQKSHTEASSILEKQLLERDKQIEEYEKKIHDYEARIRDFESEVVDQTVAQKNMQENIDIVQQSLVDKNMLIDKLKKEYEADVEKFQKQIEQLNTTIENIKKENVEKKNSDDMIVEKQLLEWDNSIERYKKEVQDFEAKIKLFESEVEDQNSSKKIMQENINAMEKDLLEKNIFIEKLQKEFGVNSEKLQKKIESLNNKIEEFTKKSNEEKKVLAEQIEQLQNVIENITKENLENKNSGNVLEKQLLEREKLIKKHEKYIEDCEARIKNFESEVVDQSVTQKNLQDDIDTAHRNVDEKNKLVEELKKEYQVSSETLNKEIEQLKNVMENLREQNIKEKKILADKMEQEKLKIENMTKECIDQKNSEYIILEKQLLDREKLIGQYEKQIKEFGEKMEKSESNAAAQTFLQKSLQDNIDAMQRELLEKNTAIGKLQKDNEVEAKKFQNEIQELNKMIENITTQSIETANSENISLQKQLLESKKLVEQQQTKIQDFETTIEKFKSEAAAQTVLHQNLQENIDVLQENLLEKGTLMEKLKIEHELNSGALQSQIEQLKNEIESKIKEGNNERKSFVEQIEQQQKIIENLTKQSEDEKTSLVEQVEQLKIIIANKTTENNKENESLLQQIQQLKNMMEETTKKSADEKKLLVEQVEQQQTMIENLSKQSNEETKSLVKEIEKLKIMNEKVTEESIQEKKSLVEEIQQLKDVNENIMKESIEEKKSLCEQIEQLKAMIESITKESEQEKKTLAEEIQQRNSEERNSLVQRIEQLEKMLENTTKQSSEDKEPLVKQIEELKITIETIIKESAAEKKLFIAQIDQQRNIIEELTKESGEEKTSLAKEIEHLKSSNEEQMKGSIEEKNLLTKQTEQLQNMIESINKESAEEKKTLLEQSEQRQNIIDNLTKQTAEEKNVLVRQIEKLNEKIENVAKERLEEKKALDEEYQKRLAELEASRSRIVELESEKASIQSQTTDQINQIANNYKTLLNHDIQISDIVRLLERKSDDIEILVKELRNRPAVCLDRNAELNQAEDLKEALSKNLETHEKRTHESKIPNVVKIPGVSSKTTGKDPNIPCDEILQLGKNLCNDLEKQISSLQEECQNSKISSNNTEKQCAEIQIALGEVKKHFDFILNEEKKLQMSITDKNTDLVKLEAAIYIVEREKRCVGVNVDFTNSKPNASKQTMRGKKEKSLESVALKNDVLQTDFEDKNVLDSLTKSEIAVKELRGKFLEFVKLLKKTKHAEPNPPVELRDAETCVKQIEELMKNYQKDFAEKIKERSTLNKELQAQIDLFESNLKGSTSVLNDKNNVMEVTANSSENIVSQIESNSKAVNELDSNELKKLLDDNEAYKGQIDFLNSVIVDMQRKNETLTCKIEVLEMGVPANEADDYSRTTLSKRATAPRMFCDICDQFDLHETEDCSRQAQDYEQPEEPKKSPKKLPIERPYCESCECFGHDTSECDNSETY
ncbi:CAP-Gly domain-containing linker protein 1 [Venturia canescens]|uniref:CAP-Gly domain-containing linker protein 1 n=1 Tax=Venturia canescens TaxID=32260 RepID=UPI001C9C5AE6|nr:CAP-Gly domain-containing linker protein 1-like [Venturia canescens]XP_043271720.1 CAP-Gly domain-containing linker protein 1-like [Venturia canescens]